MIGTKLGAYQITAKLGEGGMGEVYRATDTKLKRDVAIKVLPAAFTEDEERLARFVREAQLLAQLHHPNIASIFGLEESSGTRALVMELVEGPTLADRLESGRLPFSESLSLARQIAEALEEAHEKGIIHRDLKPQNIKASMEGKVKVLDFGLAKAMDPTGAAAGPVSPSQLAASPTMTLGATQMGVILGTAAYMAPEQAKGMPVDKRADIWAFGVVLYEMLSGRRLFGGQTVTETLAGVLKNEVDFDALPPETPPAIRRLTRRCLERDPKSRLRDIGDARLELDGAASEPVPVPLPPSTGVLRWLPWAVSATAAALAAWALASRSPAPAPVREGHFTVALPASAPILTLEVPGANEAPLAVSPDGDQVVYVSPGSSGTRLFARSMADPTPRALAGTEGARFPCFSPDGQWVGFFADGKLKKIPLAGGTPVSLAAAPAGQGCAWGFDGEILFAPTEISDLYAVPEEGGKTRRVAARDNAAGEDSFRWPQLLPEHKAVLFTAVAWSRETSEIVLADLADGSRRVVLEGAPYARYVPDAPGAATGQLLFVRGGILMAAPLDPASAGPAGPAIAVIEGVGPGQFDVSASGTLACVRGTSAAPGYSLVWVDRSGQASPINDLVRGYEDLHLSPDGRQVALTVEEEGPDSDAHVWLADVERGTLTRFTFEGLSRDPIWAPDGRSVVFGSKRGDGEFGLYRQPLDGLQPAELVWSSPIPIWPDPQSWTPDGRTILFTTKAQDTTYDIWTLSLDGERTARPWLATAAAEWGPRLSPDGRYVAYSSDESGHIEVYVQPFPGPGSKRLVSEAGGINPIWSRDGRELFYRRGNQFFAVTVDREPGFATGKPVLLFAGRHRETGRDFDVSPDGRRFVMMRSEEASTAPGFDVVLDWRRALAARRSRS